MFKISVNVSLSDVNSPAQWYVHNFDWNFVSKHFGNMFVTMLELKNVRNKLESGLTYALLSLGKHLGS